jgi:hypothetical protein
MLALAHNISNAKSSVASGLNRVLLNLDWLESSTQIHHQSHITRSYAAEQVDEGIDRSLSIMIC